MFNPIRRLARLPARHVIHELYCWFAVLFIPASYYLGGPLGLVALQICGGGGSVISDYYLSSTAKENFRTLRAHGYSASFVWSVIAFNLVSSSTGVALLVDHFGCFTARRHWDLDLLKALLLNISVAEVTFTMNHRLLHHTKWGAKFHLMHHCCRPCTWTSNLIIHPIDLAAEFSGPVISTILSHVLWFKDPFALLVTVQVLHFYYALDHSERLKLHHYYHHKNVDSFYSIYVRIRKSWSYGGEARPDLVKSMLKREEANP